MHVNSYLLKLQANDLFFFVEMYIMRQSEQIMKIVVMCEL